MSDIGLKSETITRDGYSVTFLSLPCTCFYYGARVPCIACEIQNRAERTLEQMAALNPSRPSQPEGKTK